MALTGTRYSVFKLCQQRWYFHQDLFPFPIQAGTGQEIPGPETPQREGGMRLKATLATHTLVLSVTSQKKHWTGDLNCTPPPHTTHLHSLTCACSFSFSLLLKILFHSLTGFLAHSAVSTHNLNCQMLTCDQRLGRHIQNSRYQSGSYFTWHSHRGDAPTPVWVPCFASLEPDTVRLPASTWPCHTIPSPLDTWLRMEWINKWLKSCRDQCLCVCIAVWTSGDISSLPWLLAQFHVRSLLEFDNMNCIHYSTKHS